MNSSDEDVSEEEKACATKQGLTCALNSDHIATLTTLRELPA